MQKIHNIIELILLLLLVCTGAGYFVQSYRLDQTRQELRSVRSELSAATNRQSELAEILKRDGEILSESSITISGIRSQIAVIRESYEQMQNIIDSSNCSSDR